MRTRRLSLLVALLICSVSFAAHAANRTIFILVDSAGGRAYIPEGTVLPPGLQVRAEPFAIRKAPGKDSLRERSMLQGTIASKRLHSRPALVFEYAPAERFDNARKQYEVRLGSAPRSRIQPNTGGCYDVYLSGYNSGPQWTYYNGFLSTFCGPETATIGYAYTWQFTAAGDYSDDDSTISPFAAISDDNNNYNCYNEVSGAGYGSPSCTASATTVFTNVACTNTVYTQSQLYIIEYGQNYDPYYVGFSFEVDWCATFY